MLAEMFDKKVRRGTLTLPKAHSFGFGVRVQDRLHQDILTVQDRCLMTIRDEEYTLGEPLLSGGQNWPDVNSALPMDVARLSTADNVAAESTAIQGMPSIPTAGIISVPAVSIVIATNTWNQVFTARSPAPFQKVFVQIMLAPSE